MATAQIDAAPFGKIISQADRPSPPRFYHSLAFWTILAVTIGVAWRTVRFSLQFPIWGDESFVCVNFLDKTFAGMIGPLRIGQICPLTFLWSELALYHWLGPAEWVLRLLPYLAGLGALALFWPLCKKTLAPIPAALAMALLAVSYYPVRHAVEVKPYSEDLLVTLGLLLPAVLYVLKPFQIRCLVFLTFFVPLALVSSYPAVLVAGSISMVLLPIVWRQSGLSVKVWFVLYNVLLAGAFLGNYFLVGKPQLSPHLGNPNNAFNSTWHEWFPDIDPLSLVLWFLKAHTGNMLAYPIGGPNFASSLSTLLCLVGAWSWWRVGNRQILALLAWPFALSMAAAIVHKYPYGGSARLDQHLAPAICLLMGNGIFYLLQRFASLAFSPHQGARLALIFLVVFGTVGLARDIVKPFKTTAELWNRTFVQDLMNRLGPDDRVVIFHGPQEVRPGLEWYFRQHDDRIQWHGQVDWDRLASTSGKLWCVEIHIHKPDRDPILDAVARCNPSPVQVDYYESIAPPEHGDDPEYAEVYCFERRDR